LLKSTAIRPWTQNTHEIFLQLTTLCLRHEPILFDSRNALEAVSSSDPHPAGTCGPFLVLLFAVCVSPCSVGVINGDAGDLNGGVPSTLPRIIVIGPCCLQPQVLRVSWAFWVAGESCAFPPPVSRAGKELYCDLHIALANSCRHTGCPSVGTSLKASVPT